jgi:hypothetical protein
MKLLNLFKKKEVLEPRIEMTFKEYVMGKRKELLYKTNKLKLN